MRDIRSLEQTLSENLPWHQARIKFVAAFVVALVTVKSVNLVELACAFAGKAQQDSQYKKLQRFFRFFELPYAEVATIIGGSTDAARRAAYDGVRTLRRRYRDPQQLTSREGIHS